MKTNSSTQKQEGPFLIKLVSEKSTYKPSEKIKVYAMIKYTGKETKINIEHAASLFWFDVEEKTRRIKIISEDDAVSTTRTLKKGKWYKENFSKSGEHTDDKFVQKYFNNEGFPVGEYTITATAKFNIENMNKEYSIKENIDFEVK